MKQTTELDINEKTRSDILLFNTLKDVIERVEVLEKKGVTTFIINCLLLIYVAVH